MDNINKDKDHTTSVPAKFILADVITDRRAILVHTEMQVTACRASSCTDGGNLLPGGNFRALLDVERRSVPVKAHQTAAVVYADVVTVTAVHLQRHPRCGSHPYRYRHHRCGWKHEGCFSWDEAE